MKATLTSIVLFILVASLVTPQQSLAGSRSRFDIKDVMDVVEDGSDIIIDHRRQKQREQDAAASRAERAERQAQRAEEAQRHAEIRQQQQDERLMRTQARIGMDEEGNTTRANNDRARAAQTWAKVNPGAAAAQADAETLRLAKQAEAEAALNEARVRTREAQNAELRLKIEEAKLRAELRELEEPGPTDQADAETSQVSSEADTEVTSVQTQVHVEETRDPELERLMKEARLILEEETTEGSVAK